MPIIIGKKEIIFPRSFSFWQIEKYIMMLIAQAVALIPYITDENVTMWDTIMIDPSQTKHDGDVTTLHHS